MKSNWEFFRPFFCSAAVSRVKINGFSRLLSVMHKTFCSLFISTTPSQLDFPCWALVKWQSDMFRRLNVRKNVKSHPKRKTNKLARSKERNHALSCFNFAFLAISLTPSASPARSEKRVPNSNTRRKVSQEWIECLVKTFSLLFSSSLHTLNSFHVSFTAVLLSCKSLSNLLLTHRTVTVFFYTQRGRFKPEWCRLSSGNQNFLSFSKLERLLKFHAKTAVEEVWGWSVRKTKWNFEGKFCGLLATITFHTIKERR